MKIFKIIIASILKLIVGIIFLLPFLWMINSSFRTSSDIQLAPLGLAKEIHLENYIYAWQTAKYSIYIRNSIIIIVVVLIGLVFISTLAAYSLARFRLPFRNIVLFIILCGLIIPPIILIFPIYRYFDKFHLFNLLGLILLYIGFGIPFSIFILRAYFLSLPKDLEDASRIDGCNRFETFFRIILPISKGAISTVLIFNFVGVWNEFVFAYTFINKEISKPISAGLGNFIGKYTRDYAGLFAAVTIATIPLVIIFLIFQRYFIEAIAGSLKE